MSGDERPLQFSVLDNLPFGVCICTRDFTVYFWNRTLEDWVGRKKEEMAGSNLLDVFPHLNQKRYRVRIEMTAREGAPTLFSPQLNPYFFPALRRDGGYKTLQTVISPIKLADRDEIFLLITAEDMSHYVIQLEQVMKLRMQALHEASERKKIAAALEKSEAMYRELATRDQLTQAYNRHYLEERLEEEIERCRRGGGIPLGCIMTDIDYFKRINDTRGHQFGDYVLKETADRIRACIRKYDVLCRFGGDEFIVILPGADREIIAGIAERICDRIRTAPFTADEYEESVTISIGTTVDEICSEESDLLLQKADQALYMAKEQGRNRVCRLPV